MSDTTRTELLKLASNIEQLAKEVQVKLNSDGDVLDVANELTRNNLTLAFTLGEHYALKDVTTGKTVKAKTVNTQNYHNLRDSRGRFVRKV